MNKTMAIMKNGRPEIFKDRAIRNVKRGFIHSNPTEEQLRDCGYKEYIIDETVLEEKDGFYIDTEYIENDAQIIMAQKYVEMPDEPEYGEDEFAEETVEDEIIEEIQDESE